MARSRYTNTCIMSNSVVIFLLKMSDTIEYLNYNDVQLNGQELSEFPPEDISITIDRIWIKIEQSEVYPMYLLNN